MGAFLFQVNKEFAFCSKCKLHAKCRNPRMPTMGNLKRDIMIIRECPTAIDDKKNSYFSGEQGKFLQNAFAKYGYDFYKDFIFENALACFSAKEPTKTQIKYCRERLLTAIKVTAPKVIITFGNAATFSVLSPVLKNTSVHSIDGTIIPYHDIGAFVIPMQHPNRVIKSKFDKLFPAHWDRTLKTCLEFCQNIPPLQKIKYADKIEFITTIKGIKKLFNAILPNEIKQNKAFAIDYETSGLTLQAQEHSVFSCAIAIENGQSYAFPISHPEAGFTEDEQDYIIDLLSKFLISGAYLIAHNSHYETSVSRNVLESVPIIDWCTMNIQHIIDVRPKITGLKHQVFVRWGISYDENAQKYICADESGFNKMHKQPLSEQLMYVGLDSFFTMKLFLAQEKEVYTVEGADFFNSAVRMLEKVNNNGFCVNETYFKTTTETLKNEIDALTTEIHRDSDLQGYLKQQRMAKEDFNVDSPTQLVPFFYEYLKIPIKHRTNTGKPSADETALLDINHPIIDKILKRRKYSKALSTYVLPIIDKIYDGKVYPQFLLNSARSLRSSAVAPNIQNQPKRNEEIKKIVRSGYFPAKGHRLFEADFSGVEVATSAIYHQDPVFIEYLENDDADMHRDNGCDLWVLLPNEISKEIRFYVKNGWTFPEFYGDFFGSCAETLWESSLNLPLNGNKTTIKEHIQSESFCSRFNRSPFVIEYKKYAKGALTKEDKNTMLSAIAQIETNGITSLELFKQHARMVEHYMWNVRFKVYTKWKNLIRNEYIKTGMVTTKMGFRFTGYLDKKQVTNYPIQSTAFHILLWCMIQLQEYLESINAQSFLCGEIHDSMIISIAPTEEKRIIRKIKQICEVDVRKEFLWINVPFKIDLEATPEVNQSWYYLEDYKE